MTWQAIVSIIKGDKIVKETFELSTLQELNRLIENNLFIDDIVEINTINIVERGNYEKK